MPIKLKVLSDSPEITKTIGAEFAKRILRSMPQNGAQVVTLRGDLGAGKTTFVLGFLKHFNINPKAASPTFVIMKRYAPKPLVVSRRSSVVFIYHLDAYRLHSKKDLEALDFQEILNNPKNIILVEWPEKIKGEKFKNKIAVKFDYGKKENERVISFIK